MKNAIEVTFLQLVRLGIGTANRVSLPENINWGEIEVLAEKQGLSGVVLDGIEGLPASIRPPKASLLKWIGEVLRSESINAVQYKAATEIASLFHRNCIRTYVLKGIVIAECYPKPEHRFSVDMDCYVRPNRGDFDAWSYSNDLIKSQGFEVDLDYYKNSTYILPGLTVENHQYMIPFRGNEKLTNMELMLRSYMKEDKGEDMIDGTYLYRPPMMVSSLFLIEHAYSHFLGEGLTWRHVLDWMMFSKKHYQQIDCYVLDALMDEFGFRKFYDSFNRLGKFLLGELDESGLTKIDIRMLNDVWAPLDLHETVHGIKGKLALAGNTWRARWKYHYFADISMIHALWIQVKGFLFIKHPRL